MKRFGGLRWFPVVDLNRCHSHGGSGMPGQSAAASAAEKNVHPVMNSVAPITVPKPLNEAMDRGERFCSQQ